MKLIPFVAWRYLKGKNRYFFTFSNLLSFFGIAFGVFSILIVSAVMNGFSNDMINRIIGLKGEIMIRIPDNYDSDSFREIVDSESRITGLSRLREIDTLLQSRNQLIYSLTYGIDFSDYKKFSNILDNIRIGQPNDQVMERDGILIGLDLSLQLNTTVGEYIQITSPTVNDLTPLGLIPRSKRFRVVGIFYTGLQDFDSSVSFISFENAYYLTENKSHSYYMLKTTNPSNSYRVVNSLSRKLGSEFFVQDWSETETNLYQAMKMERVVMFTVLFMMIILSAFNMVGNSIKQVALKRKEIGLLKIIGLKDDSIKAIFICKGLFIGLVSSLTGITISLILIIIQLNYGIARLPVPGFPFQELPVKFIATDYIVVFFLTMLVCGITTIIPAYKTLQITPVKIIRNI